MELAPLSTVYHITEAATLFILSENGKCRGERCFTPAKKWHKQPFVVRDELSTALKALVMALLRFHNDNTVSYSTMESPSAEMLAG